MEYDEFEGYFDTQTRELFGHTVKSCSVKVNGKSKVKYECQHCGYISNYVTGFDQSNCTKQENSQKVLLDV